MELAHHAAEVVPCGAVFDASQVPGGLFELTGLNGFSQDGSTVEMDFSDLHLFPVDGWVYRSFTPFHFQDGSAVCS